MSYVIIPLLKFKEGLILEAKVSTESMTFNYHSRITNTTGINKDFLEACNFKTIDKNEYNRMNLF